MSERIIAALKALDASNPNHWTAEGLPRLETIRILMGDQTISRADISSCAPAFTRENPVVGDVVVAPTIVVGETTGLPEINQEAEATPAPVEPSLEDLLAQCKRRQEEVQKVIDDNQRELDNLNAEHDRLVSKIENQTKAVKQAANVQSYLETQKEILAQRHKARRALLESGVSLKELAKLTQGSPIDTSRRR